jgi:ankyrin repeat protein
MGVSKILKAIIAQVTHLYKKLNTMRRVLIIAILLVGISFAYGQKNTAKDYQDLIGIVKSGDTTALSNKLGSQEINSIYDSGELPLLVYACKYGHVDMVNFLLSRGTDPNTIITKYGTIANVAVEEGHLNIVHILLDRGFNPRIEEMSYWIDKYQSGDTLIPSWMSKIITIILDNKIDYNNLPYVYFTDPSDNLLLSEVIYKGDLALAKKLITHSANVDLVDKYGRSALFSSITLLNTKAVSLLIKNKADVNLPMYSKLFYDLTSEVRYNNNMTPLHFLLYLIKEKFIIMETDKSKVQKIIKQLVSAGADINLKTKHKNQSVLDVAKEIGDDKIIKLLQK